MYKPVPGRESDEELAARAGRDRQAFLVLYDRYVGHISRYVAARTLSSDVEDLVSDTFLRALARIDSYRADRGAFGAWLFTIARNAATDHYRGSNRVLVSEPPDALCSRPGPETLAVVNETRAQIRAALRNLPADQRDAVLMRYIAGLPYVQVGQALGRSEAAAKMLVKRGLRSLQRYFQEQPNVGSQ
ncbi:MAG: RNA polymerase sigma factor [Chloroflexota bacterium]